jgi:NAD(P)-dependent dehydrogenase (short-subunit alcohol dehydrogenase family)
MSVTVNKDGVLAGKVAVITGASRGIGEAIAYRYAQEGAKVVVSARTLDDGDHVLSGGINSVVKAIQDAGGEAHAVRADLNLGEHREQLIRETEEVFGPVDILVNNAAVTYYAPVHEFSEKRFKLMMEVQVYGPFHLAGIVLPGMLERSSGWILNVSSHAAIHPPKEAGFRGGTVYGMCKAALERFTTGLASEVYGKGIGVNVISPGLIATPGAMYHNLVTEESKSRVTRVEDMAEACLALVHGDPKEVTGMVTYADQMLAQFNLEPQDLIVDLTPEELAGQI